MKKLITLFAAAITALVCLTSCGRTSTKTKELNGWQKELLAAEGLPTEADQLTDSQLRSIQRIYEMITYLNEKYDEEFIYGGYLEPAANQTETLYAYPRLLGADYGRNTVTVKATKDGFTDDYHDKSVVDYYNELVTDFIHDYFNSDDFVVFTRVNACDITKEEVVDGVFQWKLGVHDAIILDEKICSADSIEEFAVNFAKYLYEHKMDGRHRIDIIKNGNISDIAYNNFSNYYEDEYDIGFYDFSFNSDKRKIYVDSHFEKWEQNEYTIEDFFSKYN
ncbi:hypothetical protein [Ruminococcus flavefaciens]|uniref:hypothetical protein n=1 Tax=Ruminococcus flavefaciens TaxID=1265 RepID=UPI0003086E67|nr:hypothetical protein [Ruminococcus flavefaciens]